MIATVLFACALAQAPLVSQERGYLEVVVPVKPQALEVRLTSDAPASVTETRSVALTKGPNRLRFDWREERIDEGSVRIEVVPDLGSATLLARSKVWRLGGMLYFDVDASQDTRATVTSRYLLLGLGWRVAYQGLVDARPDAQPASLALKLAVEVTNGSGKDLAQARVLFDGGAVASLDLERGERREVVVRQDAALPFVRRYVFDPTRFGASPGIEIELDNATAPLARTLLPAGRIRVFGEAGDGGPSLLGEDVFPSTPVGEKARFYLGHARDLAVERTVLVQANENERRDRWNKVVAYDQRTRIRYKIQDGLARDTELVVIEKPGAPFEIVSCGVPSEKKKSDTLEMKAALRARQETVFEVEWLRRNLF